MRVIGGYDPIFSTVRLLRFEPLAIRRDSKLEFIGTSVERKSDHHYAPGSGNGFSDHHALGAGKCIAMEVAGSVGRAHDHIQIVGWIGAPVVIPEQFECRVGLTCRHVDTKFDLLLVRNPAFGGLRQQRLETSFDDEVGGHTACVRPIALYADTNQAGLRFVDYKVCISADKIVTSRAEKRGGRVRDSHKEIVAEELVLLFGWKLRCNVAEMHNQAIHLIRSFDEEVSHLAWSQVLHSCREDTTIEFDGFESQCPDVINNAARGIVIGLIAVGNLIAGTPASESFQGCNCIQVAVSLIDVARSISNQRIVRALG